MNGFSRGFSLEYQGPWDRADQSDNIPLNPEIGNEADLWAKLMKEVKAKGFTGPFSKVPYSNFIQSPIGLVPKSGNQSRLIFHLSYDFKGGGHSANHYTP